MLNQHRSLNIDLDQVSGCLVGSLGKRNETSRLLTSFKIVLLSPESFLAPGGNCYTTSVLNLRPRIFWIKSLKALHEETKGCKFNEDTFRKTLSSQLCTVQYICLSFFHTSNLHLIFTHINPTQSTNLVYRQTFHLKFPTFQTISSGEYIKDVTAKLPV